MTDKLSVASTRPFYRFERSLLREIVYCKLKWIIRRADFHFGLLVVPLLSSLAVCVSLTRSPATKERYRCLGKGFQPEVMVIPAIPFQMWLKFRRNQQGLIGVMTLEVPVTVPSTTKSSLPLSSFLLRSFVVLLLSRRRFPPPRYPRQHSRIPSATYRFATAAVYIYL